VRYSELEKGGKTEKSADKFRSRGKKIRSVKGNCRLSERERQETGAKAKCEAMQKKLPGSAMLPERI